MEASILIVTKNRKDELAFTLQKLYPYIDVSCHEVLVFLDGCTDNTHELEQHFPWVKWHISKQSVGASRARNVLYKKALGEMFFGFDDDAHPLQPDFITKTKTIFQNDLNVGIVAFKEVRGVFIDDKEAISNIKNEGESYYCNTFVGCGFAILKSDYLATRGFPIWLDIYGEEDCVSIELLANKKSILYTTEIAVNHRVNSENRSKKGRQYFRFEKQLTNETSFYLIYYRYPIKALLRLYRNNFRTYALKDTRYFLLYFKVLFKSIIDLFKIIPYRQPVSKEVVLKRRKLKMPGQ